MSHGGSGSFARGPRSVSGSTVSQQFSHISIRTISYNMNLTSRDYATIVLRAVLIGRLTNLRCARSILNVNGATDVCRFAPIYVAMNVFVVGGCWCKPGYVQGVRNGYSSRKAPQWRNSKVVARVVRPSLVLASLKAFLLSSRFGKVRWSDFETS